jgi:nucleotide-binding universal stress UspA family protein
VLDVALDHAIKGRDSLLLTRVVPEVVPDFDEVLLDSSADMDQMELNTTASKILEIYSNECACYGVESSFMVLVGDHPGNALCAAARVHKIDCIIVGRRELGTFKRLLVSATSKYCVDHAGCNVLVVKRPHQPEEITEPTFSNEEMAKKQMASEAPVGQRIWAYNAQGNIEHTKQAAPEPAKKDNLEQPEDLAHTRILERSEHLAQTRILEEAERARRIHEIDEDNDRTLRASQEDLRLVKELEEVERAERVERHIIEKEAERRTRRISRSQELEIVKKLEEEERQSRVHEMKIEQDTERETRKGESKRNLAHVRILEEQERTIRIEEAEKERDLRSTW